MKPRRLGCASSFLYMKWSLSHRGISYNMVILVLVVMTSALSCREAGERIARMETLSALWLVGRTIGRWRFAKWRLATRQQTFANTECEGPFMAAYSQMCGLPRPNVSTEETPLQRIRGFRIRPIVGERCRMKFAMYSGNSARGILPSYRL